MAFPSHLFRSELANQFRAEGRAEGKARGEARGLAESVLRVLDLRGIDVPSAIRDQILACTDPAVAEGWVARAVTATSVEDLSPESPGRGRLGRNSGQDARHDLGPADNLAKYLHRAGPEAPRAMPGLTLPLPSGDTWTRADYEALPEDLPVRVSLIHGELVVSPRPRPIHQRVARRLATRIEDDAPAEWQVDTDVDVLLDDDAVEPVEIAPDIVVYSTDHDPRERPILADLVALVAEVVSPFTKRKDRRVHPGLYAGAGIRHFWRVETDQTAPAFAVYTYELDDATGQYIATGVHHDRITVISPFELDIELKAVRER